ncbi:Argininosuccinate lyase [Gossypium australe]|uniref:Argininosuccinate lyase n=1 Tax=Gossypium australe TaxID=47621 RepID=A0A5B6VSE6_9ROSI|nr:Argininosuccinate lyase [Gossypium australe]
MGDSSASYIHMVHHLIEVCLIFNMSKEECMEALSKHANIKPVITSTAYTKGRDQRAIEVEQRQRIQTQLNASIKENQKN